MNFNCNKAYINKAGGLFKQTKGHAKNSHYIYKCNMLSYKALL